MWGFIGWMLAGAVVRRFVPAIRSRAGNRGWMTNLLAGIAIAAVERVLLSRRGLPFRGRA